jgi:predicted DNA-binding protein (UPF0251 family)
MIRSLHDTDGDTLASCLGVFNRGLRRLGITDEMLQAPPSPATIRIVEDQPPAKDITPEKIQEMVRLSRQNLSQAEIARRIGCSQSAVSKNLTRLGIRQRPPRRLEVQAAAGGMA